MTPSQQLEADDLIKQLSNMLEEYEEGFANWEDTMDLIQNVRDFLKDLEEKT